MPFNISISKSSDQICELPGEDQSLQQKTCLSFLEHLLSPIEELYPLDLVLGHLPYQIAYQTIPTDTKDKSCMHYMLKSGGLRSKAKIIVE